MSNSWIVGKYIIEKWHCSSPEHKARSFLTDNSIRIKLDGDYIRVIEGYLMEIITVKEPKLDIGDNFTGNGIPNIAILNNSVGAHCCYTLTLLELGDNLRIIDEFQLFDYEPRFFYDNHEKIWKIIVRDHPFIGYRGSTTILAPAPDVIIKCNHEEGRYLIDIAAMRKIKYKQYNEEEFKDGRNDLTNSQFDENGEPMKENFNFIYINTYYDPVNIIYTGNYDYAHEFFNKVWGDTHPHSLCDKYWQEINECNLRSSIFWKRGLAKLIGQEPEEPRCINYN